MNVATSISWVIAGTGVVLAVLTLAVFRQPVTALHVLLDLLLAAGLLRLSTEASWSAIAVTAAVILIRRVVTRGLRSGAFSAGRSRAPESAPRRRW